MVSDRGLHGNGSWEWVVGIGISFLMGGGFLGISFVGMVPLGELWGRRHYRGLHGNGV